MTVGPLLKLLEAIFELMTPLVVAGMINVGKGLGDRSYILTRGLWLFGLIVGGMLCATLGQYFAAEAAARVGRTLRTRILGHVLRLSHEQAGSFGAGRLMQSVTGDVLLIQSGINLLVRLGARVPFLAVGGVVMALLLNRTIGLIFLGSTVLLGLILFFIVRHLLGAFGEIQREQDDLASLARENLTGARVIRAFNQQGAEEAQFDHQATDLTRLMVRVGKLASLMNPVSTLLINLAIFATLYLGARHVYQDLSNPGELVALVSYMTMTLLAIAVAVHLAMICARALASAKRVEEVLEMEPIIVDGRGADPEPDAPVLIFERVSFSYAESTCPALEGVSFTLERGQTLGVIGGTGSGKSTLAGLILRFMDAETGEIQVHGGDVKAYRLEDLRGQIGYAPQRSALFSGTVAENLRMAYPEARDADLWDALKAAQAEDFVEARGAGLQAAVEQGGLNFSGGQRQRLGIACALVGRPPLVILDDAFAALDYLTDQAVRQALGEWASDTAVVLISQRVASVQNADQILVLDEGKVAGLGSHAALLASCTMYQEICRSQDIEG